MQQSRELHTDRRQYLKFTVRQASGKFHATGRTVISKDGKVMTTTGSDTDADGKAISVTLVYDKQ